ncbi:MAG: primosomal protein N', partial [Clostridium fessum]|nr:primosomal protein N' [Clostridium fessum]
MGNDADQASSWLELFRKKNYRAKIRVLEALLEQPELTDEYVSRDLKVSGETLKSLEEQGIIRLEYYTSYRNPVTEPAAEEEQKPQMLTREQQETLEGIRQEWSTNDRPCLIQGVTGSGKTLVY